MPDCWLEITVHPEGFATGQINQFFPWFTSILWKNLSWYLNSTLHGMLLMQPCRFKFITIKMKAIKISFPQLKDLLRQNPS
jgi:hypothetical protein